MWQIRKTDLQIYFVVHVGLHYVQLQPTIFSPTYVIKYGTPTFFSFKPLMEYQSRNFKER